jgi:outer membrane protein TolC
VWTFFKIAIGLTAMTTLAFCGRLAPARAAERGQTPGRARVTGSAPAVFGKAPAPQKTAPRATGPHSKQVLPAQHVDAADEADGEVVPLIPPVSPGASEDDPLLGLLDQKVVPIDLSGALRLAGLENPRILLGRQQVVEAVALRQLAAAQFLPTLNLGASTDAHWGVLQQSNGNILSVRRSDVFVGAGAYAIAGGTVNIPGILWTLNASEAAFNYLSSQQEVDRREFENQAIHQDVLLDVALSYCDLVRAQGMRSVAIVSREDARELARLTAAYLESGQGRKADADRAATEKARRDARLVEAQGEVVRASANLCRLLHLDPSIRLHAVDNQVIPRSIVPEPIPLPELLAIALMCRPDLNERRAASARALTGLRAAKMLPFSPTLFIGFSAGGFGGGSDVASAPVTSLPFGRGQATFTTLDDREDFDVMAYWTLQNLGVGNKSLIEAAGSRLRSADLEVLVVLDRVRSEVASSQARTHARFSRIASCELAIKAGIPALREDLERIRGGEGLPLEVVDSLRLLARARETYMNAIIDYNRAQFELYVALGKPPADLLLHPAPENEPPASAKP